MKITIAFHTPQLDLRGSCEALWCYAHYNEKILGNSSVIVVPLTGIQKDDRALTKFTQRFRLVIYQNNTDLEEKLMDLGCDILYVIKYGKNDNIPKIEKIRTVIHCVFDLSEPHGDVYAAVSEQLSKKYNSRFPFVPHMIGLQPSNKGNLRKSLNIPRDAIVFGRMGGMDTFDLKFAREAIWKAVREKESLYFLFMNTPKFVIHSRAIFLDGLYDNEEKNRFIQTCDAHLEAGSLGHSFGINCGEFSIHNKPIIAYTGSVWNRSHLDIIGDEVIGFKTGDELYSILINFNPKDYEGKDLNCYKDYSPEKVMKKFKEIFIHPFSFSKS